MLTRLFCCKHNNSDQVLYTIVMDVESLFSAEGDEKSGKGVSMSVWQAEVALRLSFLRKVYGILSAQLVLTVVIAGICIAVPPVKGFVQSSPAFSLVLCVATIGILIALIVKRHEAPINFYLLLAFTISEGLSLGILVTFYDVDLVIKSLLITTAVFLALTGYTMQSKYDFSTWGASLFAFLWILIIGGFIQIFFWSEVLEFVLSIGGALVFCGFIIFDTHIIMHKLSPEEYIMAAVNLYLDFVNLFVYILRIMQAARKN